MPPKKGTKRKTCAEPAAEVNGDAPLAPPDRSTWPGWVEMESEPAFFNVMLKELGVRGVKIQEVLSLDEDMIAFLPQPVHALIFLFRYKDADVTQTETQCPKDVWFANQIPDFACASVALLNIVNNIPGVEMGKQMRDFKDFTADLDPMARGDAIDGFDFLKHIHNSFARENELLSADMHMRNKVNKANKCQAIAKAKATKAAKKAGATPQTKRADSAISTPTRASKRTTKATKKRAKSCQTQIADSATSSPLSDPPDTDAEFATSERTEDGSSPLPGNATRRSGRQPKPRKDLNKDASEAQVAEDQEGFHYVAYLPVNGRVWKLDGLDSFPHMVDDLEVDGGGDWLNVAVPEIQARMMMFEDGNIVFEDGNIEFNLMAVVHDPIVAARTELAENVKELQTIDAKLDAVSNKWRFREGATPSCNDFVLGPSQIYDLVEIDIASAPSPTALEKEISRHEETFIDELVKLRQRRIKAQAPLRASVRDQLEITKADDEKARMRRHDFRSFIKGWLGALAEQGVLKDLAQEA